jgi:hypothetical protein
MGCAETLVLRLPDNRNQAARDTLAQRPRSAWEPRRRGYGETGILSAGMGRTGRAKNNSDATPPDLRLPANKDYLMIHIGYTPWHCRESPEADHRGGQNAADSAPGGASWISVADQKRRFEGVLWYQTMSRVCPGCPQSSPREERE